MEQDKNRKSNPFGGMRQARRAVSDFLRAGRRNEANRAPVKKDLVTAPDTDRPGDLVDRIRNMSDADFDNAVKTGALTPEQIRKAGEYDWDTWMGDVWMETDWPDTMVEPTYDEFMADPGKYGYQKGINEDNDRAFDRYAKYGAKKQ